MNWRNSSVLDRLNRLSRDGCLSKNDMETVRNIWYYDERHRNVCRRYRTVFDEIVDHFLNFEFYSGHGKEKSREKYIDSLKEKILASLRKGKSALMFAPLYGKMLVGFQHRHNSDNNAAIANAHRILGRAYFLNREMIEAEQNFGNAKQYAEKTNDDVLKIRVLVGYGRVLFRRGQYARAIEYFLPEEIEKYKPHYIKEYKNELEETERYFSEADKMCGNVPEKFKETITRIQSNLQCKWAQFLMVTKGVYYPGIENRLRNAVKFADSARYIFRAIDSRETLITFLNLRSEGKGEMRQLLSEIDAFNRERYSPDLMGLLEVTLGNYHYSKIRNISKNDMVSIEELKTEIDKAFHHFVMATRYQMDYSESNMYESVSILLKRIATLDAKSIKILQNEVFPELRLKAPTDPAAEKAYEKIEQFIRIRSELA